MSKSRKYARLDQERVLYSGQVQARLIMTMQNVYLMKIRIMVDSTLMMHRGLSQRLLTYGVRIGGLITIA